MLADHPSLHSGGSVAMMRVMILALLQQQQQQSSGQRHQRRIVGGGGVVVGVGVVVVVVVAAVAVAVEAAAGLLAILVFPARDVVSCTLHTVVRRSLYLLAQLGVEDCLAAFLQVIMYPFQHSTLGTRKCE